MILSTLESLAQGVFGFSVVFAQKSQYPGWASNLCDPAREFVTKKKKNSWKKNSKKNFFDKNFQNFFLSQNAEKTPKKRFLAKKTVLEKKKFFFFIFFKISNFFKFFLIFFFGFIFKNRVRRNGFGNFDKIKTVRNARLDASARFCEDFIEKYWKLKKLEGPRLKIEKSEKSQKKTGKSVHFVYPKIVEDLWSKLCQGVFAKGWSKEVNVW